MRQEGKLELKGCKEDVLTVALDAKEHPGRVRAVGSQVTPTVYFNTPKEKGKSKANLRRELMEQKARIQKLEAVVFKLDPSSAHTDEKGSCSEKMEPVNLSNAEPVRSLHSEIKPDADDVDDDVVLINTLDALQVYLETLLHNC